MRLSILFLILLNLVHFVWNYYWPPAPLYTAPPPLDQNIQTLYLLSEFEEQSEFSPEAIEQPTLTHQPPVAATEIETAGVLSRKCYSLGPFEKVSEADRAEQGIKITGMRVTRRVEMESILKGYWVYLPPTKSFAMARKVSKALASKGIKDYYILHEGENKNAISLGLYNKTAFARNRLKKIKSLGYKPVMKGNYRDKVRYWLDYRELATNSLPTEFWDAVATAKGGVQRTQKDCTID
ncbi:MAG: SPOR domain-containing protein [Gammaproteobacteria bacterium]|nr:SPOR domain-containing protein [Gammaproteobacteria bacterium]